jgi:hypothetical protein
MPQFKQLQNLFPTTLSAFRGTGMLLTLLVLTAPWGITPAATVDNTDAAFSPTGTWTASTSSPGHYGTNYLYAATGNGSAVATWRYPVGALGTYQISAR